MSDEKVFISYSSDDSGQQPGIIQAIEAAGERWWADRNIPPGYPFPQEIVSEIRASLCLVVHITENSLKSDWVPREIQHAEENHKTIIPLFRKAGVGSPGEVTGPEWAVRLLRSVNAIRYNHNIGKRTKRSLTEAIRRIRSRPRKGKVISFVNFKGGVGKTTLCALSAYYLAREHKKNVLLLDLDPQENLTDLYLTPEQALLASREKNTALSLFEPSHLQDDDGEESDEDSVDLTEVVPLDPRDFDLYPAVGGPVLPEDILSVPTDLDGPSRFSIVPSDFRMMKFFRASRELHEIYKSNMRQSLGVLAQAYDYVLIDCGPSASMLSYCSLGLSDRIVAPIWPDNSATRGLLTMRQAAQHLFDTDILDKVHPVFNFSRTRAQERYMIQFTTHPELISDRLDFVRGKTMRTFVSFSSKLRGIPEFFQQRGVVAPETPTTVLTRHLGDNASGQIQALCREIIATANGERDEPQDPAADRANS